MDAAIRDCIKYIKKFEKVFQIDKATFVQADNDMQDILAAAFDTVDSIDPLSSEELDRRQKLIARRAEFPRTITGGKFPIVGLHRWDWTGYYYNTVCGARTYTYSRNNFYATTKESVADRYGFPFEAFNSGSSYHIEWRLNRERFWDDYINELEIAQFGTILDFVDHSHLKNIEWLFTSNIENKINTYFT